VPSCTSGSCRQATGTLPRAFEKLEGEQKTHASIISILADEIVKLKKPAKLPAVSKRQFGFRSE
jgi:hypothetical protein